MKLYKALPTQASINGRLVPIRTDYRYALRAFDVISDRGISDEERALAVIYIVFGRLPDDNEPMEPWLEKARIFLQCGETAEDQHSRPADMSFTHDAPLIAASFASDYGIDLHATQMHWWRFVELIGGLTEKSALSRVREIRNINLTEIKDAKTRMAYAKAQAAVALPVEHTAEETDAWSAFEAQLANEQGEK